MEWIIVGVFLVGFVVVDMRNAHRFSQFKNEAPVPPQPVPVEVKKPKYEFNSDFSKVASAILQQMKKKPMRIKYNVDLAEWLYQLAAMEYGTDCVQVEEKQELSQDKRYYNRVFYISIVE